MKSDLQILAIYSSLLSLLALITYFISRAVERRLERSGNKRARLWGALTFVLSYFITLFVIGTVILLQLSFSRR
jgi:Na+/proline symporter